MEALLSVLIKKKFDLLPPNKALLSQPINIFIVHEKKASLCKIIIFSTWWIIMLMQVLSRRLEISFEQSKISEIDFYIEPGRI